MFLMCSFFGTLLNTIVLCMLKTTARIKVLRVKAKTFRNENQPRQR